VEKLAALNCTLEEIAAFFSVSLPTIDRLVAIGREAIECGRYKGRLSVRREQFKLLQAGNATMGIWLGKQLLGQRDYDRERIFRADPQRTADKPIVPEWLLKHWQQQAAAPEPAGNTNPSQPSSGSTPTPEASTKATQDQSEAENQRLSATRLSSWRN
jgi:hypothetical protein